MRMFPERFKEVGRPILNAGSWLSRREKQAEQSILVSAPWLGVTSAPHSLWMSLYPCCSCHPPTNWTPASWVFGVGWRWVDSLRSTQVLGTRLLAKTYEGSWTEPATLGFPRHHHAGHPSKRSFVMCPLSTDAVPLRTPLRTEDDVASTPN